MGVANGAEPRRLRYAIIGAGMSGLLAGIRLRERGEDDFIIFEKADEIGGTWRENRYPGVACDVPAHMYSYSFALNPEWSHFLAPGRDIQAYFLRVARERDLYRSIRFGCEIRSCRFDGAAWHLENSHGERHVADVVIAATGVLHHPYMPDIAGLESFAGPCFHSARWPEGLDLADKRVGVIGTGSTAVQIVSALAGKTRQLVQFCRTPQWVVPGLDLPYPEAQRATWRSDPAELAAARADPLVQGFVEHIAAAVIDVDSPEVRQIADDAAAFLATVRDPELRAKLTPDYHAACKRIVISIDYYEKIQHPTAVFETTGIERVTPDGIQLKDGRFQPLDVLVLATGFRADRFVRPVNVIGENGLALDTAWAKGPTAYYAVAMPGFPNFFFLNGPTGPVGNFSLIDIAEHQWGFIDQLLDLVRTRRCNTVAPKPEALARYDAERIEAARKTVWASGCSSWYLDSEGVPQSWPWHYQRYREVMAQPRMEDFLCS